MTAKRSSRTNRNRPGGRVTPKGTRPDTHGEPDADRPRPEMTVRRARRDEPFKGRRQGGRPIGARAAQRGMR
ncbi:MAG: hypothetical protein S0880_23300 [Actinomycetota bacterium]|nr:hypothetical protein [Actinomycetota bacterium]